MINKYMGCGATVDKSVSNIFSKLINIKTIWKTMQMYNIKYSFIFGRVLWLLTKHTNSTIASFQRRRVYHHKTPVSYQYCICNIDVFKKLNI